LDEAATYKWYGRNLARKCMLFSRVHPIVEYGVKYEMIDPDVREPILLLE
jgi:hypothetical protein